MIANIKQLSTKCDEIKLDINLACIVIWCVPATEIALSCNTPLFLCEVHEIFWKNANEETGSLLTRAPSYGSVICMINNTLFTKRKFVTVSHLFYNFVGDFRTAAYVHDTIKCYSQLHGISRRILCSSYWILSNRHLLSSFDFHIGRRFPSRKLYLQYNFLR